ncbi:MAG: hypothetical protein JWQ35_2562 [Bacteriovoracaceae bacterium]|nr:hypothetical protein [Bacteriovoracaceae bacterium]
MGNAYPCAKQIARLGTGVEKIDFRSPSSLTSFYRKGNLEGLGFLILNDGTRGAVRRIGSGSHGSVYRLGTRVIKIANSPRLTASLALENKSYPALLDAGIRVAKIFNVKDKEPKYLVKEFIAGPSGKEIRDSNAYTPQMIEDLAKNFIRAFDQGVMVDVFRAENFVWSKSEERFVLVDAVLRKFEVSNIPNYVKMQDWIQEFFSSQKDKQAFKKAIRNLKGNSYWRSLVKEQDTYLINAHGMKAFTDPI